jgi:hypothetical protein
MVVFSEKRRQIGGNGIDQVFLLGFITLINSIAKGIETAIKLLTDTLAQTAIDHILFGIGQHNTGMRSDKLSDSAEMFVRKAKFSAQPSRHRILSLFKRRADESALISA